MKAYAGYFDGIRDCRLKMTFPQDTRSEPITVAIEGAGTGQVSYGHVQVRVEQFAEAVVVLDYTGSGTRTRTTSSSSWPTARN